MRIVGVIPCRYGAVRFPGKPIALIHGKPMVWHVYQQALKATALDDVVVATDDERIASTCERFGIPAVMTSREHATGTDRLAECAASIDADFFVNVQGDEPMVAPAAIDLVAQAIALSDDPSVLASNGYKSIQDSEELNNPHVVKVTLTADGMAHAFSREPRARQDDATQVAHYRQLGLYAFRRDGLQAFAALAPGPLEQALHVEMLRFLEHGYRVAMVRVPDDEGVPVDTPADLEKVARMMARHAASER